VNSRKPLNLSMRGVVGGEEMSWMSGTSLRVHDVCEMPPVVWKIPFSLRARGTQHRTTSVLKPRFAGHLVISVINLYHECIEGASDASRIAYARLVACVLAHFLASLHRPWALMDTYKYGRTASSHGGCIHWPKCASALLRNGQYWSNHQSNQNRDMSGYTRL